MDIIDFFRTEQKNLHAALRSSVSDLAPEEWHYTLGNGNHIAFILWHCVRTEDNITRFILQQRPPIWNEGNWHERLQLPPRVQGTGMATEEAHTLHLNDPALFMRYAEQVWHESEEYLATINDGGTALSQRMVMVKPLGEISALWAIGRVCITHLLTHLGEISLLRGAQSKQGQFLQ